jgi:hypothetical protein
MDKKKFEQVLNQHAAKWYIDSSEPITWGLKEPHKKKLKSGEEKEVNTTGCPQVIKWNPVFTHCQRCDQHVVNQREELNIHKKTTKCSCRQKYDWTVCHPFKSSDKLTYNGDDV